MKILKILASHGFSTFSVLLGSESVRDWVDNLLGQMDNLADSSADSSGNQEPYRFSEF